MSTYCDYLPPSPTQATGTRWCVLVGCCAGGISSRREPRPAPACTACENRFPTGKIKTGPTPHAPAATNYCATTYDHRPGRIQFSQRIVFGEMGNYPMGNYPKGNAERGKGNGAQATSRAPPISLSPFPFRISPLVHSPSPFSESLVCCQFGLLPQAGTSTLWALGIVRGAGG